MRVKVTYEIEVENEQEAQESIPDDAKFDNIFVIEDKPTDRYEVPITHHVLVAVCNEKDEPTDWIMARVTGWCKGDWQYIGPEKHYDFPTGELVMLAKALPKKAQE